jgi:uncharacterized protein
VITFLAILVGAYLLLLGYLFIVQRSLLYLPDRTVPDLAAAGLGPGRAVSLTTADGLQLLAWHAPSGAPDAPVMVYLHGNAGHIGHRAGKVLPYLEAGWGLLLVEYRGYGGNPGQPTEAGLYADARAALDFVQAAGVPADRIVLYGESLGAAVAVQVASERTVGALVLEAPFAALGSLAQHHYPYVPARWLVRDRFDTLSKIAGVGTPLLILHGERDAVTPVRFGRLVFEAAADPKHSRFFPEGGHVDLNDYGAAQIVMDFVERRGVAR